MQKAMMRLRNGKHIQLELKINRLKERNETQEHLVEARVPEAKLESKVQTPDLKGKSHFLRWVNAGDCVKDNLTGCYLTQILEISASKPKRHKQNGNHYELMKKRLKTVEIRKGKEEFKDCLSEWEDLDTDEDKLTTPISVPSHYKKYTVEERKIRNLSKETLQGYLTMDLRTLRKLI